MKRFSNLIDCVLIKVQFWGARTVTAVETQGNGTPGGTAFVKQYRLEFSMDCITFYPMLDAIGNNKVLCVMSRLFLVALSCSNKNVTSHKSLILTGFSVFTQMYLCFPIYSSSN